MEGAVTAVLAWPVCKVCAGAGAVVAVVTAGAAAAAAAAANVAVANTVGATWWTFTAAEVAKDGAEMCTGCAGGKAVGVCGAVGAGVGIGAGMVRGAGVALLAPRPAAGVWVAAGWVGTVGLAVVTLRERFAAD